MKRFLSILLVLMVLVSSSIAESATGQEVRTFTEDELAYDAYLDIAYAYEYGVKYLKELGRLWDIALQADSIRTLNRLSYAELFYDANSSEQLASIFVLFSVKLNYGSSMEALDLLYRANNFSFTQGTDLILSALAMEEEAKYLQSNETLKNYLDNAMAKIRTLMQTNPDYPFLKDIQSYYKDATLLYDYFSAFSDNYTSFTTKKDNFVNSELSWKVNFEFIFNAEDYAYVNSIRQQAETEKLKKIYQQATELEKAGNYTEAIELFWDSYPYEGAGEALARCIDAKQQEEVEAYYQAAYTEEKNGNYSTALIMYQTLNDYKDSSTRMEICREKKEQQPFEGRWCWMNTDYLSMDVYSHAYNPYDEYYQINFENKTITLQFTTSTSQTTEVKSFEVISPTTISCPSFRSNDTRTWYFHLTEDKNYMVLTFDPDNEPYGKSLRRIN